MKHLNTRNGRLIGGIWMFCLALLILVWTNYLHQRNSDRNDTIASAVQRNSNLAVALEQYAIRTIHNADAILQLVKLEYNRKGSAIDIEKLLFTNAVNKDIFKGVGIIDKNGRIIKVSAGLRADSVINVSDRDYFQHHLYNRENRLYISKPILSRTIGKTVIAISSRIATADGSFGGVVAIQIEPSTFTSFYAQANLRKNDIISLIAPDGTTYARRTGSIESQGENISKSPLFRHVANNADSFYFAKDAIRGIPTYFSYRSFKEYPIIATVGTSQEDVLADFYKRAERDLTSTIIITVLVVLFSALISLLLVHRRKMADKLMEEEERYQQQLTEQVIAAQEREREVISHELHDNVNQVLTTVKLYLEMAVHKKEAREGLIEKSITLVMFSIDEIRKLSRELSAPTLGTRSLVDSITALVEMVALSSGLKIYFEYGSYQRPLPMNQKLAIYRMVQEQLNNVIKHAAATNVWISLSQKNGHTILQVKDDGKGFNMSDKRKGIGLNNITSRAKVFNGTVEIGSAPRKGCLLEVRLPFIESDETVLLQDI